MNTVHRPSRIVDQITRRNDKKFEPVAHMADTIIDHILANGSCSPTDLQTAGFSVEKIERLWHFAHSLAAIELKILANKNPSFPETEARYA